MNTGLMFSSAGDLWRTPKPFVTWLRSRFDFTLDAAASDTSVAPRFINAEQDALATPWSGRVFCNPPYSIGDSFVANAVLEIPNCEGICLLVPARTDTAWWQDSWHAWNRVELLRGRLKFWLTPEELIAVNAQRAKEGKPPLGPENSAPFPSALLVAGFGLKGRSVECVNWKTHAAAVAA